MLLAEFHGFRYYATQYLATLINNEVGGDIVPIIPTNAYPLGYDETADKAKMNVTMMNALNLNRLE